jgi:hypothetical protein
MPKLHHTWPKPISFLLFALDKNNYALLHKLLVIPLPIDHKPNLAAFMSTNWLAAQRMNDLSEAFNNLLVSYHEAQRLQFILMVWRDIKICGNKESVARKSMDLFLELLKNPQRLTWQELFNGYRIRCTRDDLEAIKTSLIKTERDLKLKNPNYESELLNRLIKLLNTCKQDTFDLLPSEYACL